jgi:hypothetical protein
MSAIRCSLIRALLALSVVVFGVLATRAQNVNLERAKDAAEEVRPTPSKPKLGLLLHDANAYPGYTLLAPTNSTQTYLIDMQGRVVQTWKSDCNPGFESQRRPRGFGDFPPAGQLMSSSVERRLKLTAEQKLQLAAVQKEVDSRLNTLLQDAQKKQLKRMQDWARAFQTGGNRGGFTGGFGPPGGGGLFRAPRYGVTYAGLAGKDLKPGKTIEEILQANRDKPR